MTEPDRVARTIAYYDEHGHAFGAQTGDLDLEPLYQPFLRCVPEGGCILDAGCGTGRDAAAFAKRGYRVVAFDASSTMVRQARSRLEGGWPVLQMCFDEVAWDAEFDGVWTCASLLHVPHERFERVGCKLANALRPGGVWYLSFKLGDGERFERGRVFVDHTESTLLTALRPLPLEVVELWRTNDVRPGRGAERWLNAIVRRQ